MGVECHKLLLSGSSSVWEYACDKYNFCRYTEPFPNLVIRFSNVGIGYCSSMEALLTVIL